MSGTLRIDLLAQSAKPSAESILRRVDDELTAGIIALAGQYGY